MDYIVKAYKDWKLHSQFHEIVPDMDEDYIFNEKQSIRDSARSLKKYGSTCCNNIRNNETLIRHEIEKTDTLQGIALKYGCSTEQIRRANRLFASDSLFLRQFLLVPVEKTSPYYPKADESNQDVQTSPTGSTTSSTSSSSTPTSQSPTPTPTPTLTNSTTTARDIILGVTALANSTSERNLVDNNCSSLDQTPTNSNIITASTTTNLPTNNVHNTPRTSTGLPPRPYSIAGELSMQDASNLNGFSEHNGSCSTTSVNNHHHHHNGSGGAGSVSNEKQSKSLDSVATMTPEEENRRCINEFLKKIDNTISESRKYVEKSKEMVASQSDNDLFVATDVVQRRRNNQHRNNNYQNYQHYNAQHMRQSSNGSNSDTAQLLNTTQTRHVQSRLSHLEKQQDEFFEL